MLGLTLGLVALPACTADGISDYSADNRDAFLASCVDPLEDELIDVEICQCVFDAVQATMAYEDFVELEASLVEFPERALPSEVVDIVADCVVRAADL